MMMNIARLPRFTKRAYGQRILIRSRGLKVSPEDPLWILKNHNISKQQGTSYVLATEHLTEALRGDVSPTISSQLVQYLNSPAIQEVESYINKTTLIALLTTKFGQRWLTQIYTTLVGNFSNRDTKKRMTESEKNLALALLDLYLENRRGIKNLMKTHASGAKSVISEFNRSRAETTMDADQLVFSGARHFLDQVDKFAMNIFQERADSNQWTFPEDDRLYIKFWRIYFGQHNVYKSSIHEDNIRKTTKDLLTARADEFVRRLQMPQSDPRHIDFMWIACHRQYTHLLSRAIHEHSSPDMAVALLNVIPKSEEGFVELATNPNGKLFLLNMFNATLADTRPESIKQNIIKPSVDHLFPLCSLSGGNDFLSYLIHQPNAVLPIFDKIVSKDNTKVLFGNQGDIGVSIGTAYLAKKLIGKLAIEYPKQAKQFEHWIITNLHEIIQHNQGRQFTKFFLNTSSQKTAKAWLTELTHDTAKFENTVSNGREFFKNYANLSELDHFSKRHMEMFYNLMMKNRMDVDLAHIYRSLEPAYVKRKGAPSFDDTKAMGASTPVSFLKWEDIDLENRRDLDDTIHVGLIQLIRDNNSDDLLEVFVYLSRWLTDNLPAVRKQTIIHSYYNVAMTMLKYDKVLKDSKIKEVAKTEQNAYSSGLLTYWTTLLARDGYYLRMLLKHKNLIEITIGLLRRLQAMKTDAENDCSGDWVAVESALVNFVTKHLRELSSHQSACHFVLNFIKEPVYLESVMEALTTEQEIFTLMTGSISNFVMERIMKEDDRAAGIIAETLSVPEIYELMLHRTSKNVTKEVLMAYEVPVKLFGTLNDLHLRAGYKVKPYHEMTDFFLIGKVHELIQDIFNHRPEQPAEIQLILSRFVQREAATRNRYHDSPKGRFLLIAHTDFLKWYREYCDEFNNGRPLVFSRLTRKQLDYGNKVDRSLSDRVFTSKEKEKEYTLEIEYDNDIDEYEPSLMKIRRARSKRLDPTREANIKRKEAGFEADTDLSWQSQSSVLTSRNRTD